MQGKRRAATAALTVVLALGAAGCGAADAPSDAAPVPPRPAGTGPLTKDVVRADVDGAVRAAGAPSGDPEWAAMGDRDPAGCTVAYKGFAAKEAPADLARYEALRDELGKRAWRLTGEPSRRERDGEVHSVVQVLKQRGWSMVVEFRAGVEEGEGEIAARAYEDACVKKSGRLETPAG
ncbi:hypothetical protein AB0M64_02140 [Streptomyces sp. NPDC051771]|uniref:hypothetical protein n=1 Tax=Streptomyces sp. NPDC051771 TaxID=3154847 RepID=UPI00344472F6